MQEHITLRAVLQPIRFIDPVFTRLVRNSYPQLVCVTSPVLSRRQLDSKKASRFASYCICFVASATSRFRTQRTTRNRVASQADGNVKKICRGKEDKGPVSYEARTFSRIRDDPQHYRERIERNRPIRRLLGSRTFLLGTRSLLPSSRSGSSFFRFSRRLDISFARPLILERTKT